MRGTLVLAILEVRSSYVDEVEEPLRSPDDVPDTLQWWIDANGAWRIKTFALDHDIHVHSVGTTKPGLVDLAQANNKKHYGDVISRQYVFEFFDCTDDEEVRRTFATHKLPPRLEIAPGRFAFWKPDDEEYRTKSTPK
jgi:hypothetical protein